MLEKKRIEEAQKNVQAYLSEGLLVKYKKYNSNIFQVYVNNAKESLKIAELLLNDQYSFLWTIVCSYYSMFYIANAVLYKLGFKVGPRIAHRVSADSLIVYVRNKLKISLIEDYEEAKEEALELAGLKTDELLQSFDYERIKESRFQYETTEEIKQSKAKTSFQRAKEFIFEMEKLIEKMEQ